MAKAAMIVRQSAVKLPILQGSLVLGLSLRRLN